MEVMKNLTCGAPQEHVTKGADLDRLSETHRVRQNAAEPLAVHVLLPGLYDVIVEESNTANLYINHRYQLCHS